MDNRKTIFRFILSALFIFMIMSLIFSFLNTPISEISKSLLAISGDIKIKKIEYNPVAEELAKDKKRMEMAKRMSVPVQKKTTASAKKVKEQPDLKRRTDVDAVKKGLYIESAGNTNPKAVMSINSRKQVALNYDAWQGEKDLSVTCVLQKDSSGITAILNVTDDNLVAESEMPYHNDCVELYFDFRPAASRGGEKYDKGVFQLIAVPYFSKQIPDSIHFYSGGTNLDVKVPGATVRSEKITDGYRMKIFLPLSGLKSIGIVPDKEFNFDFAVIDIDQNSKKMQLLWSGASNNSQSPKYFGHMKLLE